MFWRKKKRKLKRRVAPRAPELTVQQILAWADLHHQSTGQWPKRTSGKILGAIGENWSAVDASLSQGHRGLPGGSSLACLLEEERGVRNQGNLPPLSEEQILQWADDWHARTGHWPTKDSGRIPGSSGEAWGNVQAALLDGYRGFPGGATIAQLLQEKRGVRNHRNLPSFTEEMILQWADAYYRDRHTWPKELSGQIPGTQETWINVAIALRRGLRGLPGGSSLACLLMEKRGVRHRLKVHQ